MFTVTGVRCREDEYTGIATFIVHVDLHRVGEGALEGLSDEEVKKLVHDVGETLAGNPIRCFAEAGEALLDLEILSPLFELNRMVVLGVSRKNKIVKVVFHMRLQ